MQNLSIRRLEVFLAIVDEGGFAAAAERLGISQPSVSAHIVALERDIGAPAFERRHGRRPLLTDVGRSVLQHAREIVGGALDLKSNVVRLARSSAEMVVFSCQRSLANFTLKDEIIRFARQNEQTELVVRIGRYEDVCLELREGVADLGCLLSNEEIRGFASEVIGRQSLVLVASPNHPLAKRKRILPSVLSKQRFVGAPPTSAFGRAVIKLLHQAGLRDINVVAQATEYPFIRELVTAGVGITCSPFQNVASDVRSGVLALIDFDVTDFALDVRLLMSSRRARSGAIDEFATVLRNSDIK